MIREPVSRAPFNSERVQVAKCYRQLSYQGRNIGNREDALFLHMVQRVKYDQEWVEGTTMDEYPDDIHRAHRMERPRSSINGIRNRRHRWPEPYTE